MNPSPTRRRTFLSVPIIAAAVGDASAAADSLLFWPAATGDPEDAPVIDFGTSDACSVRSLKNRIAEAALADDAAGFRRALLEFQEHWGDLLNIPPPMTS
jgi:hypothetical protein